ncbi:hypothetical protein GCM10010435_04840 [Winogradskya consettensis]|uniref:HTH araC/xylS-type domain-containing protein n=1 Tax=Winogradskya consettensis TaxID=113560 RepID=A0A919VUP0_9ACTN|nr:helix-turn-helix transcriptional regulator [Actinoplanes consettensis]GIM79629.1 hypothetical protein Aco04nite_66530 [Actinoplanes consettensis]
MSTWFSGPGVIRHRVRGTTAMEHPDPGTLLVWPADAPGPVVMGPRTRARYYSTRADAVCRALRFRPGAATRFLGVPLNDLTDRIVPLRSHAPVLPPQQSPLLQKATALLENGVSVQDTARRLHLSERHLRNLFTAALGMPPLRYLSLRRVNTVLDHPGLPLPELATLAGYYDQSHMTAEFRRLVGTPPAAFRAGNWPAAEPCT